MASLSYPLAGQVLDSFMTSAGRLVYTTYTIAQPQQFEVVCWDSSTTSVVWTFPLPAASAWPEGLAVDESASAVYLGSAGGIVYALDLGTGRQKWTFDGHVQIGSDCVVLAGHQVVVINALYEYWLLAADGSVVKSGSGPDPNSGPSAFPIAAAYDATTNTVTCFLQSDGGSGAFGFSLTTNALLWKTPHLGNAEYASRAAGGGRVYVPGGDTLFALDANTGAQVWSYQISAGVWPPLFLPASVAGGKDSVYFGDANGDLYDVDAASGHLNWVCPITAAISGTTSSVAITSIVFSASDSQLYLLGYEQFNPRLICAGTIDPAGGGQYSAAAPVGATQNNVWSPAAANGVAYVPTGIVGQTGWVSTSLYAVDFQWAQGLSFASSPGRLLEKSASDAATGTEVTLTLPPRNGKPQANVPVALWSVAESTIFANGGSYAVSQAQKAVVNTDGAGQLRFTVSSAGPYFATTPETPEGAWINIPIRGAESFAAVDPDATRIRPMAAQGRIPQIIIESELIVGTYDQTSATLKPQDAQYQTYIRLVDQFGNPRRNYAATFSAVDTCTITAAGTAYTIGPTQTQTLNTDGSGQMSLVVTAPTRVTLPALTMQCDFMNGGSLTVNVDVTATSKMGNVTKDGLAPDAATAYDGQPLLTSDYQSEDNRTAIATSFQNTMGGQQTTNSRFFRANPFVKPSRANGVRFTPPSLAFLPAEAGYQIGPIANFTLSVTDTSVTFTPMSDADVQEHVRRMAEFNIFGDFLDFVENVWNGIEHVATVVATTVARVTTFVVKTIVNGVEKAYSFVATTLREAGAAIASFMKTVAQAVERFIEFLSYLFEWRDFLRTKDLIKDTCSSNLNAFRGWWSSASAEATTNINSFFASLEGDIVTIENRIIVALGGQPSAGGVNASTNDPQAQFSGGGARSYAKTQWMAGKIQSASPSFSVALSPASDPYARLVSTFETFFVNTTATLAGTAPTLAADVEKLFTSFTSLMSSPAQFASTGLTSLVQLLGDIAQTVLKVANAATIGLLNIFGDLLNAIWDIINQPLDIPFVSWLYHLLTGSTLTILDGLALLVAIPATIIYKVLGSSFEAAFVANSAATINLTHVCYSFTLSVLTLFDLGSALVSGEAVSPLAGITLALSSIAQLLSMPLRTFGGNNQWYDYVMWAFLSLPLIGGGLDFSALGGGGSAFVRETWLPKRNELYCGYGGCMLTAVCAWGDAWPDDYKGTNAKILIQNLFSVIMYPFKLLAGTPAEPFLAFMTITGDGVNAGMSYQYLTG